MCSHEVRRAWPILPPGTFVPKVTLAQAQGTTGAGASSSGAGASSSGLDRSVTGSGASKAPRLQSPPLGWIGASPVPGAASSTATPAPAAAPTPRGSVGEEGGGDLPRKLAEAHSDDKAELVSMLSQSVEQNTGAKVGTGSGPTDLSGIIAEAVAKDDVVDQPDWSNDSEKEDEEEKEEPKGGQETGVTDLRFGDGRVPSEANWGLDDLPERVTKNELNYLVRRGPRTNLDEPRVSINLVKQLGWILHIRRKVLEQKHRPPPVPGKVVLLAPHYKDGMELIHKDMRKVLRYYLPDPLPADALGSSAVAEECMYVGMHA